MHQGSANRYPFLPDRRSGNQYLYYSSRICRYMNVWLLPVIVLIIIAICCMPVSGTGNSSSQTGNPVDQADLNTLEDLTRYVREAVNFARESGKDAALATFNDPNGSFSSKNHYIFAYDYNGTVLALPHEPEEIGTNRIDLTDRYQVFMIKEMIDAASHGGGVVTYFYPNPADNMAESQKNAVILPVDDTWWIGAGISVPETMELKQVGGTIQPVSPADLAAFVDEAAAYAGDVGKDQAIETFSDPKEPFVRGNQYIFAYDYNGVTLVHPRNPWAKNLSLLNYRDINGVSTVGNALVTALHGGGYTHGVRKTVTGNGTIYIPSLTYSLPVDDTWWIGSSVPNPDYLTLATGDLSGNRKGTYSLSEMAALVDDAIAYAHENGRDALFDEINTPEGQFSRGDLWIWASDNDGILLADPYMKEAIGENIWDHTDSYGAMTTMQAIDLVGEGGGFFYGFFVDTRTDTGKEEPKLMYVRPAGPDWWIGTGAYGVLVE